MVAKALKLLPVALRKLRTAVGLPVSALAVTGLVWFMLWPARLVLLAVPLRRLARFYGRDHGVEIVIPEASARDEESAVFVREAIALAVRYSPKSANCYPQALVARLLLRLRRVPYGMFFGLRKGEGDKAMDAHAWVMVGDIPVSGGRSFDSYTVVRCFTGSDQK